MYYLSNFSRKAEVECAEALNFLPEMEGGILSYKEHLIKPETGDLSICFLKRYGLKAEESVFLDDTLKNVEAAEEQGNPWHPLPDQRAGGRGTAQAWHGLLN